jgi:hypothetical protein
VYGPDIFTCSVNGIGAGFGGTGIHGIEKMIFEFARYSFMVLGICLVINTLIRFVAYFQKKEKFLKTEVGGALFAMVFVFMVSE